MADSYTSAYNLTKPEVNASRNTWGGKYNENMDKIDQELNIIDQELARRIEKQDGDSGDEVSTEITWTTPQTFTARAEFSSGANFSGNTAVSFSRPPKADSKTLATREYVHDVLPNGTILMWSGNRSNIPTGWFLCDGSNGTPNLQGRFVRAITNDSRVNAGEAGGRERHTHNGGKTDDHRLSWNEMPTHNHGASMSTEGGHRHRIGVPRGDGDIEIGADQTTTPVNGLRVSGQDAMTYEGQHRHNISISIAGGDRPHSHGIPDEDHLPPYYALCYIMKKAPLNDLS